MTVGIRVRACLLLHVGIHAFGMCVREVGPRTCVRTGSTLLESNLALRVHLTCFLGLAHLVDAGLAREPTASKSPTHSSAPCNLHLLMCRQNVLWNPTSSCGAGSREPKWGRNVTDNNDAHANAGRLFACFRIRVYPSRTE